MESLPPTEENIQKLAALIKELIQKKNTSSPIIAELLGTEPNSLKDWCYVASATLYQYFDGKNLTLYRKKDIADKFHWWCITDSGTVIDITADQYSIEGQPIPSDDPDDAERSNLMGFPSYKKKVQKLMAELHDQLQT